MSAICHSVRGDKRCVSIAPWAGCNSIVNSKASKLEKSALDSFNTVEEAFSSLVMKKAKEGVPKTFSTIYEGF